MALKYSRQREAIKEFMMSRKDHPTADSVYMHIRDEYPNISLGTVYRNLQLLTELGELQKIRVGDGLDHFDADTSLHYHFYCNSCGAVIDITRCPYRWIVLPCSLFRCHPIKLSFVITFA